jgi:hypothetical protein
MRARPMSWRVAEEVPRRIAADADSPDRFSLAAREAEVV